MNEGSLKPKAIGFYWTLPVPWAGFTRISECDVEAAAKQSRTIDLQRRIIRRWVAENRVDLIHERAFLELAPDRGTENIETFLSDLVALAARQGATILFIDFGRVMQQRSHHFLRGFVGKNAELFEDIDPAEHERIMFDQHFGEWRKRQLRWSSDKNKRLQTSRLRAQEMRNAGLSYPAIASQLITEGLSSLTGRPWTGENVRKMLKIDRGSQGGKSREAEGATVNDDSMSQ